VDEEMYKWAESEAKGKDMKYAEAYKVMILQEEEKEEKVGS